MKTTWGTVCGLALLGGLLLSGCGEKGPGKDVPPDEKAACKDAGSRVTVSGYFLPSSGLCVLDDCFGYVVAEVPPTTQGLPMKRLSASARIGDGKNEVKSVTPGGTDWLLSSAHDWNGTAIPGGAIARYSGKLKAGDNDGCSLDIDRIDPPAVPGAAASAR